MRGVLLPFSPFLSSAGVLVRVHTSSADLRPSAASGRGSAFRAWLRPVWPFLALSSAVSVFQPAQSSDTKATRHVVSMYILFYCNSIYILMKKDRYPCIGRLSLRFMFCYSVSSGNDLMYLSRTSSGL